MKAIDFYTSRIDGFETMTFEDRRYWVEYERLGSEKMHTKATLKGLFRVKPAKSECPVGSYKNDYKQEIELYHFDQCVPMRALSKKPRSEAQKTATEKLVKSNIENSPRGQAITLCKELVDTKAIVIDTETTDLDGVAIQIAAVCCATREVLYSSLIYTDEAISGEAFDVHGITADMIKDAPKPEQVYREMSEICKDRHLVAFNLDFDLSVCHRTFDEPEGERSFQCAGWSCAMFDVAVPALGSTNRYGTISLSDAMDCAGVRREGVAHEAGSDALGTVDLIRKIAEGL